MKVKNFGQRNGHQVTPLSIGAMRLPRDVASGKNMHPAAENKR